MKANDLKLLNNDLDLCTLYTWSTNWIKSVGPMGMRRRKKNRKTLNLLRMSNPIFFFWEFPRSISLQRSLRLINHLSIVKPLNFVQNKKKQWTVK